MCYMPNTPSHPFGVPNAQYDHMLRLNLSLSRQILFFTSPHRIFTTRSYHAALRHTRQLQSTLPVLNSLAAQPWHLAALSALSAALSAARARAAKKNMVSPAQDVFALLSSFLGMTADCLTAACGAEIWEVVCEGPVRQVRRRVADRMNKKLEPKRDVGKRDSTGSMEKLLRTRSERKPGSSFRFKKQEPKPDFNKKKARALSSLNEYVSRSSSMY